jgi:surface antigen
MRGQVTSFIAGMLLVCATGAEARSAASQAFGGGPTASLSGVLECVPYARNTSGIRIYGDAHTWWSQAAGKYARGAVPKIGAVLAIRPHGNSSLGHVATVSRVVDARTILISHANWSSPGQIERNVTATDVSPMNDWSQVRVWFAPIQSLGAAHWPVAGFIYNAKPGSTALGSIGSSKVQAERTQNIKVAKPVKSASTLTKFVAPKTTLVRFGNEPHLAVPARKASARAVAPKIAPKRPAQAQTRKDPIGAIIAAAY